MLNRFDEARQGLGTLNPKSKSDWVAYHIGAIIDLKEGLFEAAQKKLEYGLEHVPFRGQKAYFASALVTCHIQMKKYEEAAEILDFEAYFTTKKAQQARNILRVHIKVEHNDISGARVLFDQVLTLSENTQIFPVATLCEQFKQRYSALSGRNDNALDEAARHDLDKEIFANELLLVA